MLTSTFVQKEPVQVSPPQSVSEIKIPETNVMSILVEKDGKVFMSLDKQNDRLAVLEKMGELYKIEFTQEELKKFSLAPNFGVPVHGMKQFLALPSEEQDRIIMNYGIPTDSTNNELKNWVKFSRETNNELVIAIKADGNTPYPMIRDIMNTLQDLRENRYNLITSLRDMPAI
jgi:biopolymer transport protein ExbD